MIEGYLGRVQPDEARGWAYDRERPDSHIRVDIYCGMDYLGSATAGIFREDLVKAGIGSGKHGFSFRFPAPLVHSQLPSVVARVNAPGSPANGLELPRFQTEGQENLPISARSSAAAYSDDTQFPVFVLGAPRSGTSAVVYSLVTATSYRGHMEGQVLDLLAPLLRTLRRFYDSKVDEIAIADRDTMIKKLPEEYFTNGFCHLVAQAARQLFSTPRWCDKTPTRDMIWAAPQLLQIWPNAKFIFLKRRAFENLNSRIRKFSMPFEAHCMAWAGCMDAWLTIRAQLAGRALQLDQQFVARRPESAADAIGTLLALEAAEVQKLASLLAQHERERTGSNALQTYDAAALGWTAEQWSIFDRVCGPVMEAYGYSRDANYWLSGMAAQSCLML
jgi:hypothetical protein